MRPDSLTDCPRLSRKDTRSPALWGGRRVRGPWEQPTPSTRATC